MERAPNGESQRLARRSEGVDFVKLTVEKLFRCGIAENLSWQSVNTVGKEADIIGGIIRDALTLRNETAQHFVVAFVGTFLP